MDVMKCRYTIKQVLKMEIKVLKCLKFKYNAPNYLNFLDIFWTILYGFGEKSQLYFMA